jgi:hypothetical protein
MARNDIGTGVLPFLAVDQLRKNMAAFQNFSLPGVFNLKPSNTIKIRKIKARTRNGLGRSRLGFIGDRTSRGEKCGTGEGYTNQRYYRHSSVFAREIARLGFPTNTQSIFGLSNQTVANTLLEDPRLALGAGWDINSTGLFSFGGKMFTAPASTSSALTFTPEGNVNTFDVYYVRASGKGAFTIDVDGGAVLATPNANGSSALIKQTVTTTLGAHALNTSTLLAARSIS